MFFRLRFLGPAVIAVAVMTIAAGCSSSNRPTIMSHASGAASAASAGRHNAAAASVTPAGSSAGENDIETSSESYAGYQHFAANGSTVTDHGIPLFQETQALRWRPAGRARRVAARLNLISATHDFDPVSIFMKHVGGQPTVFYYHRHGSTSEGHLIATVDARTARQFGYGGRADLLAYWWRDVLRDHVLITKGEPPRWTTRYASTLELLYEQLQQLRAGVPSQSSFDEALSRLAPGEVQALKTLYVNVPVNYHPTPNSIAAAEASDIDEEPSPTSR